MCQGTARASSLLRQRELRGLTRLAGGAAGPSTASELRSRAGIEAADVVSPESKLSNLDQANAW